MRLSKLVCLLVIFATIGCGSKVSRFAAEEDLASSAAGGDKSEELALKGEKLFHNPDGLLLSAEFFEASLKINNNNLRARLYMAALRPILKFKGIFRRIQPLLSSLNPTDQYPIQNAIHNVRTPARITHFLWDGREDIHDEEDLRLLLLDVSQSITELRSTLESISKETLYVNFRKIKPGLSQITISNHCHVIPKGPLNVEEKCDIFTSEGQQRFRLDFPDWEALRILASGYQFSLLSSAAYSFTGLVNVVNGSRKITLNKNTPMSTEDVTKLVQAQKHLGLLRDRTQLQLGLDAGKDFVTDARLFMNMNRELCQDRPDNLFRTGLCVSEDLKSKMPMLATLFEAPTKVALDVAQRRTIIGYDQNGYPIMRNSLPKKYFTIMDLTKPLNGSVTDIKTQLPHKFSECGNATDLPDKTFGGLFPRGDGIQVLKNGDSMFLNYPCTSY